MQRLRETLTLILLGLLPFHAFLLTVLTRIIEGTGQPPIGWLALWKEALLAIILAIAIAEIIAMGRRKSLKIDWIDVLILVLLNVGIVASLRDWDAPILRFVYGFKYDFVPLLVFLVLRRVPFSEQFFRSLAVLIICVSGAVALYGIDTFFLPGHFFAWLGYSDLHSLYVPGGPLAAFQQIEGTAIRRIQSTFSGPNQFGLWLLLPWSFASLSLLSRFTMNTTGWRRLKEVFLGQKFQKEDLHLPFLVLILIALILTFSRAAWIAASVIFGLALYWSVPHEQLLQWRKRALIGGGIVVIILSVAFPAVFLRQSSSRAHWERPLSAIRTIWEHPLGLGLGTAGPASNRTSDPCVYLAEGADASWAREHPDLCVIIGGAQVLPERRPCKCPLLPENWYLQMGVEMGVAGFILYAVLMFLLLWKLTVHGAKLSTSYVHPSLGQAIVLSFIGISIAALFLHAWEDSAVAYTLWLLLACVLTHDVLHRESFKDAR